MPIPVLQITDAGLAAIQALSGTDTVTITQMGLTNTAFIAAPTLTALPGEFKRLDAVGGEAVAPNLTHLAAYDTGADVWTATGLGLYLADGTLFAAYSGGSSLISKAALSFGLVACDIAFSNDLSASIAFGNPVFTVPPASTTIRGIVRLATTADAEEGVDEFLVITSAVLKTLLDALATSLLSHTVGVDGLLTGGGEIGGDPIIGLDAATVAETDAGEIDDKVVVPAALVNILASIADKVPLEREIAASGLLTGGGSLDGDLVLAVPKASPAATIAGAADNSAVTPLGLASFPKSFGTNGYATMPGGLIIQQGRVTASANAVTSVTFPLAFPSACYAVVASGAGTDDNLDAKDNWPAVHASAITTAGFTMFSATDGDVPTSWIAIGS